jgi:hypothetical protein
MNLQPIWAGAPISDWLCVSGKTDSIASSNIKTALLIVAWLMGAAMRMLLLIAVGLFLNGCAGLQFNPTPQPDSLTYNEPVPYFQVIKNQDCTVTGTVVSLPGRARSVAFKNGYGTADLTVNLQNGIITSVNQKTDSKVPETLNAISSLAGVAKRGFRNPDKTPCPAAATLYPIIDGIPDRRHPIRLSNF